MIQVEEPKASAPNEINSALIRQRDLRFSDGSEVWLHYYDGSTWTPAVYYSILMCDENVHIRYDEVDSHRLSFRSTELTIKVTTSNNYGKPCSNHISSLKSKLGQETQTEEKGLSTTERCDAVDLVEAKFKRRRWHCHIFPTEASGAFTGSSFSTSLHMPAQFGWEFLVDVIAGGDGSVGQELCRRHCCSIDLDTELVVTTGLSQRRSGINDTLKAQLTGDSLQNLSHYRFALEEPCASPFIRCFEDICLSNLEDETIIEEKVKESFTRGTSFH